MHSNAKESIAFTPQLVYCTQQMNNTKFSALNSPILGFTICINQNAFCISWKIVPQVVQTETYYLFFNQLIVFFLNKIFAIDFHLFIKHLPLQIFAMNKVPEFVARMQWNCSYCKCELQEFHCSLFIGQVTSESISYSYCW